MLEREAGETDHELFRPDVVFDELMFVGGGVGHGRKVENEVGVGFVRPLVNVFEEVKMDAL